MPSFPTRPQRFCAAQCFGMGIDAALPPQRLRLGFWLRRKLFQEQHPDNSVPLSRRLEVPVHDNPVSSIAGQRHATLPAYPVARGLQQFSGDAAVTSLGDHIQTFHVSGSPSLKLRQIVANRELGESQHTAFFIFRFQHSRRFRQCASEERRDLLTMLRIVPGPQSAPQPFPARGIVTSDRPNFDADRLWWHGAFPRTLDLEQRSSGRHYQRTAVRQQQNRAHGASQGTKSNDAEGT